MAVSYRLIRSKRKTLAIHITKDAQVEVRAPRRMPDAVITRFVGEKERWIRQKQSDIARRHAKRQAFTIGEGDTLLLLGQSYPVAIRKDADRVFFDGHAFILPPGPFEKTKPMLVALYKQLAGSVLNNRVAHFGEQMQVSPSGVRVTSAATRWGSCSGKNSLCFSWRLVMAPPDAVDYVVVHELAHCVVHSHAPAFWQLVQTHLPDYRDREAKLRILQQRLSEENWNIA